MGLSSVFCSLSASFSIVLDRGRITSTVAVLTSFLAFSLLLGELIFSADCDLRVAHTKANLVEYVLVVDRVNLRRMRSTCHRDVPTVFCLSLRGGGRCMVSLRGGG